jgi:hypothetical protein
MPAPRKVTDAERAEIERSVRAREEEQFPQYEIRIEIADMTDDQGKIPVNVQRLPRLEPSLELWPKRKP